MPRIIFTCFAALAAVLSSPAEAAIIMPPAVENGVDVGANLGPTSPISPPLFNSGFQPLTSSLNFSGFSVSGRLLGSATLAAHVESTGSASGFSGIGSGSFGLSMQRLAAVDLTSSASTFITFRVSEAEQFDFSGSLSLGGDTNHRGAQFKLADEDDNVLFDFLRVTNGSETFHVTGNLVPGRDYRFSSLYLIQDTDVLGTAGLVLEAHADLEYSLHIVSDQSLATTVPEPNGLAVWVLGAFSFASSAVRRRRDS